MVNTFSGWLFNLIIWGAVVTFVLLLSEITSHGFLASQLDQIRALIGLGVVALLAALWPRF
jgi:hypothetical protein